MYFIYKCSVSPYYEPLLWLMIWMYVQTKPAWEILKWRIYLNFLLDTTAYFNSSVVENFRGFRDLISNCETFPVKHLYLYNKNYAVSDKQ